MRKEFYQAIVSRLQEITDENTKESIFKVFGLWHPEVLNETDTTLTGEPAVFIEFLPIKWSAPCGGVQTGSLQIRLHILNSISADTENRLRLLDLAEMVKKYMTEWRNSNYGRIVCTESSVNHEKAVKECSETFQMMIR